MKCSNCEAEIDKCDECHENFKVGQEIVCMDDPFVGGTKLHFCSDSCKENWLEEHIWAEEAEVENSEDEEGES